MTLCPVALAVGCRRCPMFRICPAKQIIGDYVPDPPPPPPPETGATPPERETDRD